MQALYNVEVVPGLGSKDWVRIIGLRPGLNERTPG